MSLTSTGPVFTGGVRMTVAGARWSSPQPEGPAAFADVYARRSHTRVAQYPGVRYRNLRPGIDLFFHSAASAVEYDFVLAPGADPAAIRLRFPGQQIALESGDLIAGPLRHRRPIAYQDSAAGRHYIEADYRLRDGEVTFEIGPYDHTLPLTIDPVLTYATFAGGSASEAGRGIAVDSSGNAYLGGTTDSPNFPSVQGGRAAGVRGFISKLDPSGSNVLASAVIAGASVESIALDASNNVIATGIIYEGSFPGATAGAYKQAGASGYVAKFTQDASGFKLAFVATLAGSPVSVALDSIASIYVTGSGGPGLETTAGVAQGTSAGGSDAFAVKLSSDGERLLYATYLGGSSDDSGRAIAVNSGGEAYLAGDTTSADFRVTPGAFQTKFGGRVPGDDAVFGDAFLAKLDASGGLVFSTYVGGTAPDIAWGVTVDKDGNAYLAGGTQSADFPTTAGVLQSKYAGGTSLIDGADPAGDAFLVKFTASGARVWSTFLGGKSRDVAVAVKVDTAGSVYAAGSSESADFPWTAGAVRGCRNGGPWVAQIDANGTKLMRTSSVGGLGFDQAYSLALDDKSGVFLAGDVSSRPFFSSGAAAQRVYGGGDTDAFAAKLDWQSDGRVYVSCVLNAASFAPGNFDFFPNGGVAPGEVVSIFGSSLGPDDPAVAQPVAGRFPTTLGGTQVFFDGVPAPMWYASPTQINAVVPYSVKAPVTQLTVQRDGATDGPRTLPVSSAVPGIFTATGTGQGQAAVINQDWTYNSVENPAPRGSVITFFLVGAGAMTPTQVDGVVQPNSLPLPEPAGAVKVQIRGVDARIDYAGAAPGYIAGLTQINVQVPESIPFGNSVPLTVSIGGKESQFNLTIAVK